MPRRILIKGTLTEFRDTNAISALSSTLLDTRSGPMRILILGVSGVSSSRKKGILGYLAKH